MLTIPYLQYTQLYTKTYCGLWLVIDDLPDTLGVSAGRALLPVNISDPAALLRLALGVEVSVVVTVATLVREAKTGLLGYVLYQSYGSNEAT